MSLLTIDNRDKDEMIRMLESEVEALRRPDLGVLVKRIEELDNELAEAHETITHLIGETSVEMIDQ